MTDRLFFDIILCNEFSANEIPFTVTDMLNEAQEDQIKIWKEIKESQLISIYKFIGSIPHILSQDDVKDVAHTQSHVWGPTLLRQS